MTRSEAQRLEDALRQSSALHPTSPPHNHQRQQPQEDFLESTGAHFEDKFKSSTLIGFGGLMTPGPSEHNPGSDGHHFMGRMSTEKAFNLIDDPSHEALYGMALGSAQPQPELGSVNPSDILPNRPSEHIHPAHEVATRPLHSLLLTQSSVDTANAAPLLVSSPHRRAASVKEGTQNSHVANPQQHSHIPSSQQHEQGPGSKVQHLQTRPAATHISESEGEDLSDPEDDQDEDERVVHRAPPAARRHATASAAAAPSSKQPSPPSVQAKRAKTSAAAPTKGSAKGKKRSIVIADDEAEEEAEARGDSIQAAKEAGADAQSESDYEAQTKSTKKKPTAAAARRAATSHGSASKKNDDTSSAAAPTTGRTRRAATSRAVTYTEPWTKDGELRKNLPNASEAGVMHASQQRSQERRDKVQEELAGVKKCGRQASKARGNADAEESDADAGAEDREDEKEEGVSPKDGATRASEAVKATAEDDPDSQPRRPAKRAKTTPAKTSAAKGSIKAKPAQSRQVVASSRDEGEAEEEARETSESEHESSSPARGRKPPNRAASAKAPSSTAAVSPAKLSRSKTELPPKKGAASKGAKGTAKGKGKAAKSGAKAKGKGKVVADENDDISEDEEVGDTTAATTSVADTSIEDVSPVRAATLRRSKTAPATREVPKGKGKARALDPTPASSANKEQTEEEQQAQPAAPGKENNDPASSASANTVPAPKATARAETPRAGTPSMTQSKSFYGKPLTSLITPSSARRPGLGKRISIPTLHPDRKPLSEVRKKFVPVVKAKRVKKPEKKQKKNPDETPEERAERKRLEAEDGIFTVTSEEENGDSEEEEEGEKVVVPTKRKRIYSDCDTDEEEERLRNERKRMMEGVDEGYM